MLRFVLDHLHIKKMWKNAVMNMPFIKQVRHQYKTKEMCNKVVI